MTTSANYKKSRARAYGNLLSKLDDETEALEKQKALGSVAAQMKAQRAAEEKRAEDIRARAKATIELRQKQFEEEKERERQRIEHEKAEKERLKREQQEAELREIEAKTKRFYTTKNKTGNPRTNGILYYGDFQSKGNAWLPHGVGEFEVRGDTIYEGHFFKGRMQGEGCIQFANDDKWKGQFFRDVPHGLGIHTFAKGGPPRASIYRHSRQVCFLDELVPGTRIRLTNRVKHSRMPSGTIMEQSHPSKAWFKVKLDMGGFMTLDLSSEDFEMVKHGSRYTLLDHVLARQKGIMAPPMERELRFDYDALLKETAPRRTEYEENFYHEVPPMAVVKKKSQLKENAERWQKQNEALKLKLKEQAAQRKTQSAVNTARQEERSKAEALAAENARFAAETQAKRDALTAKQNRAV